MVRQLKSKKISFRAVRVPKKKEEYRRTCWLPLSNIILPGYTGLGLSNGLMNVSYFCVAETSSSSLN